MATEVVMPQMGESIAEGTITKWLVRVGEVVEQDQPLFEISTDKVDAEIPSPASGVLLEIRHGEGETVAVDTVVAAIGEEGERPSAQPEAKTEGPPAEERPAERAEQAAATVETTEAATPLEEEGREAPKRREAPQGEEAELAERLRKASSPVVRKIAEEENVDISQIEGTGIHGRVTKDDILAYIEGRGEERPAKEAVPEHVSAMPSAAAVAAVASRETVAVPMARRDPGEFFVPAYTPGERVEIEPMSKIRQITAAHMAYSKATSAHVSTVFHIDMSRVHRVRAKAKDAFYAANGTKLTYMPFIFKAVAAALRRHGKLNASVDGTNIVYKKDINLGMAVALDWGLIVPVIKNADRLSLVGLAAAANDLAERARSKRLKPDEVQGGTFTITNPGVFGSLLGTPIINQPQVAILGIGAIEKRPVVAEDEEGNDTIAIKMMSYFAITYDHRIVDGADADHFMNDVKKMLEEERWSELEVGG